MITILEKIQDSIQRSRLRRRADSSGTLNLSPDEAFDVLFQLMDEGMAPWAKDDLKIKDVIMNRREDKLPEIFSRTTIWGYKVNIVPRVS